MATSLSTSTATIAWSDNVVEKINSVTFMKGRDISFTATACKPNTKLYPFFDDIRVDAYITPTGKTLGDALITDANGTVSGVFYLPSSKFTVGVKYFMLSQNPTTVLNGHITGDAVASFQSFGYAQSLRKTTTEIKETQSVSGATVQSTGSSIRKVVTLPASSQSSVSIDSAGVTQTAAVTIPASTATSGSNQATVTPTTQTAVSNLVYAANSERSYTLAQSFNTFGLTDGVFITSVDVYFKSKSATAPVVLELRTMRSGFPSEELVSESARSVIQAINIPISTTATERTRFYFDFPIYLASSSDYCFVVRSNSTEYNLFVSEVGGISIETNKMISEQPFVGSLFKSENNNTWTAEAYKDIKFKMNRAKFNTASTAFVNTTIKPVPYNISGQGITTFVGSRVVRVNCNYYKHGLDSTSKVNIKTNGLSTAVYNGYTDANMNGTFDISKIINDYIFEFRLDAGTCTKTGTIDTTQQLTNIYVERGGSQYTAPKVEIIGGGGTGVTATAVVINGAISLVNITNPGDGYTSAPTVVITDPVGSGAVLKAFVSTYFEVSTNNVADVIVTNVANNIVSGTDIRAELSLTSPGYIPLNTQTIELSEANYIGKTAVIASDYNETARMGGTESTVLTHSLYSSNDYVSPMVFLNGASVVTSNFHINWQEDESVDFDTVNGTGQVESIIVDNAGGSYSGTPSIVFSEPDTTGVTAMGTAVIEGGVLTGITVVTAGSGYTSAPEITINGGGGTGAAATAVLSKFNTELNATGGTALSRYVSNITGLATASTAATIYVDAYSHARSSFEVYFRSTLAADTSEHKQQPWKMMKCDIARNKSIDPDQVLEYKFTIDNLSEFDTFDIKIVLRSLDVANPPIIKSYRAIVVA